MFLFLMEISDLIRRLEAFIPDSHQGLPEEVFRLVSRLTPLVNVDLLIQDAKLGTLLTWRNDDFSAAGWHVPGGIIRFKETAAARVRAVARGELRVDVEFDPAPIAISEGINHALQTRGHFFSLLFRCRLTTPLDESRRFRPEQPQPDFWGWHKSYPADMIPAHDFYRRFF